MNQSKIAEFRSEANACAVKAVAATDETSKLYEARGVLSGMSMPAVDANRAKVIAKGNIADLIIKGLQLSETEYYGLVIAYRGGALWKKEMREWALRPDFPETVGRAVR